VPVILHGYNKKIDIARKMISNGYYLSFGAALLNPTLPAAAVLSNISPDRYFLETDDAAVNIKEVYKKAAEIRNTDVDTIILQVRNNFQTVFNRL
jgi:TatD DNase family protein